MIVRWAQARNAKIIGAINAAHPDDVATMPKGRASIMYRLDSRGVRAKPRAGSLLIHVMNGGCDQKPLGSGRRRFHSRFRNGLGH